MSCGSTLCTTIQYDLTADAPASRPFAGFGRPAQTPLGWLGNISFSYERGRQRRQLLELDDRLLADIGISRHQAIEEARKSWRIRVTMWRTCR